MRFFGPVIGISVLVFLGYFLWKFQRQLESHSLHLEKGTPSSYQDALKRSAAESKPVILIFSASWCGPCQYMKHEVYPSPAVQSIAQKFIWLYIDVDDDANRTLLEKYSVSPIPNIIVVDSQGHVKNRQLGACEPDRFVYFLSSSL